MRASDKRSPVDKAGQQRQQARATRWLRSARTSGQWPCAPLDRRCRSPRPSYGQLAGLHGTEDQLDLKSSVALVIDQDTREVLFSKNDSRRAADRVAHQAHDRPARSAKPSCRWTRLITITQDDVDTEKGSSSRLRVGTMLTRGELLHLALMSSENRAAHALGRTYPGGLARLRAA